MKKDYALVVYGVLGLVGKTINEDFENQTIPSL
jgi:hypothetical protein